MLPCDSAEPDGPLTAEALEALVSGWTKAAKLEAEAMLVPITKLFESGNSAAAMQAIVHLLTEQNIEIRRINELRLLAARLCFGKQSEKLSLHQLAIDFAAFGGVLDAAGLAPANPALPTPDPSGADIDEADTESPGALNPNVPPVYGPKKKHGGGGRRPFPKDLKRVENLIRIPDAERACEICGLERTCMTHVEHVRLAYVPGHLEAHVEIREVVSCSPCRMDASTAPREAVKAQVRAAPSLLAEAMIMKCDDALPMHRFREQLLRLGIDLAPSTLGRWWDYVTKLLGPLADVIVGRILADESIGVDDTGLLYLDPSEGGKKRPARKGHLWCFVGLKSLVGFRFTRTWTADDIATHLGLAEGFVQGDGYAGYGKDVDIGAGKRPLVRPDRRLGCMTHARRPFHDLVVLKDSRALVPLGLFREIYVLENEYRLRELDAQARGLERAARSLPLFEKLAAWVHQVHPRLRPKDPLASATGYFLNQEPYLRRCFTDGRFEIDTSRVERAIREVAIGRKNFVLTGSAAGGERLASAYTVVESARRTLGTERVREYLVDVITRIENGIPLVELHDLVPDVWLAKKTA